MADEAEGGRVGTGVLWASAVQQAVKHPSILTASVSGATAEEGVRAGVEEEKNTRVAFAKVKVMLRLCQCRHAHPWNTQVSDSSARLT